MTRVLIAEPSPDVRALLRRAVTRLGFDPFELSAAVRANPRGFDILLLEPAVRGGLELAREARRHDPALPIVVCSIHSPTPEVAVLGPCAHLVKPFHREQLADALLGPRPPCRPRAPWPRAAPPARARSCARWTGWRPAG